MEKAARSPLRSVVVAFLAALMAAAFSFGCSESNAPGGSGGSAGVGGAAGDGGASGAGGVGGNGGSGGTPAGLRTYPMVFLHTAPEGVSFLEGVEVCEADTENCATSDAVGQLSIDVPANQAVVFTMEKEGYGSVIHGDVSDEDYGPAGGGATPTIMYSDAELTAVAEQLETTYPWKKGVVALARYPDENPGVTFTPVGYTADAVGGRFYYDQVSNEYSLELDATTEKRQSYLLPLAEGGFLEVTPGTQQFEFGGTAGDCTPSWGWTGDAPNRIRVPVRSGYVTYGSMKCPRQ